MNFFAQRRTILIRDLKRDSLDAVLITHTPNVRYLTGFSGSSAYLVATGKQYILVTDSRYREQATTECPDLEIHIRGQDETLLEATAVVLNQVAAKAASVEANHVSLEMFEKLKTVANKTTFMPQAGRVEAQRIMKDPSEVEAVRAAVRIAERSFHMFQAMLKETDTEKEMVDAMEGYLRRAGADRSAFSTIVAVGDRGALPHAPPTSKSLLEGSKLLVDWGCSLNGYHSDLTRTLRSPFGVNPSRRNKQERVGFDLEEIHGVIVKAQHAALAVIRDGVTAKEVDTAARKVIDDAGFGEYFTHGLGHGIGLEVHEAPYLRQNSTETLEAGMIITLEPGIYIPGWGGVRVEDDVLVRRESGGMLSTLSQSVSALD